MNRASEKLSYPIGHFECPSEITKKQITQWITVLEKLPQRLAQLVGPLSDEQLNTPYRPQGWTVRQLVHHLSDSHHNSYIRFKWALTEVSPLIKVYKEKQWAELFDGKTAPIQMSLDHLRAVHIKLVYLLNGLTATELKRSFIHPESKVEITLERNIGHYAWHSNHHCAHIEVLLLRKGWL